MKIFLAGHKGLVGSAILKKLKQKGYKKIITINKSKLNLLNQNSVNNFLKKKKTTNCNNCSSESRRNFSKQ